MISKSGKNIFSIVLLRVMSRDKGMETTSANKNAINNLAKVKASAVRVYARVGRDISICDVPTIKNKTRKVAVRMMSGIKIVE